MPTFAEVIVRVVAKLMELIIDAAKEPKGLEKLLDKRLSDVLSKPLQSQLAKAAADERAKGKFN